MYALDAEERVQAIVDSLTVLPENRVAVPFTMGKVAVRVRAIEAVGLSAVVDRRPCPRMMSARCFGTWTVPAPGRVVPAGSRVTIVVLDSRMPG